MRTPLYLLLTIAAIPIQAADVDSDEILRSSAARIHITWTEVMQKPKLRYTKITKDTVKSLHGKWGGTYVEDGEEEKMELSIVLKADGGWTSEEFRPDMKDCHWYLSDGMLLLFESKISDGADIDDLASALTLNDGKLRLILAEAEGFFVELTKVEQGSAR